MNESLNQRDVEAQLRRTGSSGKGTADSLTQREIDAILQKTTAVPLAPAVSDDVVPYNFSRPPRVSKDRRANLESIYTRFALSLQALLASLLRAPLDVVVGSVEQAMFSEYILPFELTSVLLLGAIVGVVAMSKRKLAGGAK